MGSDSAEMVKEIKDKVILHWNCRSLKSFPDAIRVYGSHIREIYLKWNKLTTLPPWIAELFNVTNLYIYGNLIKELPKELGDMKQLTVLDLSANRLEQVPPCLGNLSNLKSLLLDDNYIQKLPFEMSQLCSLEAISLSGNQLVALPEWIGSLQMLKEIYADNNDLRELPNRLTLSPNLSMVSVCTNRLRYLPLNGFLSNPCIRYGGNEHLNYVSYPVAYQLFSKCPRYCLLRDSWRLELLKIHLGNDTSNVNIKLRVSSASLRGVNDDFDIVLPRQLLIVHDARENQIISLYELALRKVYTERYIHTVDVFPASKSIKILFERRKSKSILPVHFANCSSYNLIINGPTSICVNSQCNQPIFTEAYIIVGFNYDLDNATVALCCCKRCACDFLASTATAAEFQTARWDRVN